VGLGATDTARACRSLFGPSRRHILDPRAINIRRDPPFGSWCGTGIPVLDVHTANEPASVFVGPNELGQSIRGILAEAAALAAKVARRITTRGTPHCASPATTIIETGGAGQLPLVGPRGLDGSRGWLIGQVSQHAPCTRIFR
jgi:hypothetical protein